MDEISLRNEIDNKLEAAQIKAFGYCTLSPSERMETLYEQRLRRGDACSLELREDPKALVDASRTLNGAKSALVILLPHNPYTFEDKPLCGTFATGTASEDYHRTIHRILDPVARWLVDQGVHCKVICDTSPLSDREMAVRAGLGMIRRNGMFYHKTFGSYVHIGSILMDVDIATRDHTSPVDPCGMCRRCVEHCPGKAIKGDYTINSNRCISYLTQKKTLSVEESDALGNRLYGCDTCQQVCPANRGVSNPERPLLIEKELALTDVLEMNKAVFAKTIAKTSAGWRGLRMLKRNGLAVLGNDDSEEGLMLLKGFRTDSPLLQEAKAAALKHRQQG